MNPLTLEQLKKLLIQASKIEFAEQEKNKQILLVYLKYYRDNLVNSMPEREFGVGIFAEWYQDMLMEDKTKEEAFQIAFVTDLAGSISDLADDFNIRVQYVIDLFGDLSVLDGPESYDKMLEVFGGKLIKKVGKLLDSQYRFIVENHPYIAEINERLRPMEERFDKDFGDEDNPILYTKEKGAYETYMDEDYQDYTENYTSELVSEFADEFGREEDFFHKHEYKYEELEKEIEYRVSENYNINKLDQFLLDTGGFVTNVIEEALEVWKNRLED